jgi:hypothetical protein
MYLTSTSLFAPAVDTCCTPEYDDKLVDVLSVVPRLAEVEDPATAPAIVLPALLAAVAAIGAAAVLLDVTTGVLAATTATLVLALGVDVLVETAVAA